MKDRIFDYAKTTYQVVPDYPFPTAPAYAVLRHSDNRKWFALLMNVNRDKLGLKDGAPVDILNLKCSPMMSGVLRQQKGILPAYHMNRDSWITVLLDGTVPYDSIVPLLDMSYYLTASKKRRAGKVNWLIPANPKYCDISAAIHENSEQTFYWKQSSNVSAGDIVYMYVTAPVSAILYQCKALEVDIPYQYADENIRMSRLMKLKLLESYEHEPVSRDKLKEHGVTTIRGPRYMPDSLVEEIKWKGKCGESYEKTSGTLL